MEYSKNTFISPTECDDIVDYIEDVGVHFSYTHDIKAWYCKRIPEDDFNKKIINNFFEKYYNGLIKLHINLDEFNMQDFNISLTKYEDGRYLNLHLDKSSQITSVVILSDNFEDGRFLLSDNSKLTHGASKAVPLLRSVPDSSFDLAKKIHLEKGEMLTFDGTKLYHGVMPVHTGTRYSLNIWMTDDSNYKFIKPSHKKSLI